MSAGVSMEKYKLGGKNRWQATQMDFFWFFGGTCLKMERMQKTGCGILLI